MKVRIIKFVTAFWGLKEDQTKTEKMLFLASQVSVMLAFLGSSLFTFEQHPYLGAVLCSGTFLVAFICFSAAYNKQRRKRGLLP